MKSRIVFILGMLFCFCTNPVSNSDKETLIVGLNVDTFLIRYFLNIVDTTAFFSKKGKSFDYSTVDIQYDKWQTVDLHFSITDTLYFIDVSPSKNDTICFDSIWVEDTNSSTVIYTINQDYRSNQLVILGDGDGGSLACTPQLDTSTLAFYKTFTRSDTTYSAGIGFLHPVVTKGYVRIRIKANKLR